MTSLSNFDALFTSEALAKLLKDMEDDKVETDSTRPHSRFADSEWVPSEKEEDE